MKKGFTLVELLAVIAILAILVIIALPNIMGMFNSAKKKSFLNEIINKDQESINVLFVHHKSDLPSAQIKKLAENNPIALIRSQITKRSADA